MLVSWEGQVDGGLMHFHVGGELSLADRVGAVLGVALESLKGRKGRLEHNPPLVSILRTQRALEDTVRVGSFEGRLDQGRSMVGVARLLGRGLEGKRLRHGHGVTEGQSHLD